VTAADDPTLGGMGGPEPMEGDVTLPREELDVLRRTLEAVACGPVDGVWNGLRAPIEYLRAAAPCGETRASRRGSIAGCTLDRGHSGEHEFWLPNHVSVPGKTLADDAAEHDRERLAMSGTSLHWGLGVEPTTGRESL
jgi:hypothetical protein